MDHGRAFRLQADRDARARQLRAVVGDERDIGDAAHTHDAWDAACVAHAVDDRGEHLAVVEAADRLADLVAEGRADRDHDLCRIVAARRLAAVAGLGAPPSWAQSRAVPRPRRAAAPAAAPSARPRAGSRFPGRGRRSGR